MSLLPRCATNQPTDQSLICMEKNPLKTLLIRTVCHLPLCPSTIIIDRWCCFFFSYIYIYYCSQSVSRINPQVAISYGNFIGSVHRCLQLEWIRLSIGFWSGLLCCLMAWHARYRNKSLIVIIIININSRDNNSERQECCGNINS